MLFKLSTGFLVLAAHYLFAGADSGGERAAAIYSLLGINSQTQRDRPAGLLELRPRPYRRVPDQPYRGYWYRGASPINSPNIAKGRSS